VTITYCAYRFELEETYSYSDAN